MGRPLVDQTGLSGTFDFTIEFAPDIENALGPTFQQALKDQLGIKLESQKNHVDTLVVDHVEHLIEN